MGIVLSGGSEFPEPAAPMSGKQALFEARAAHFELLAIYYDHAVALDGLPLHHRDPFDRLLVAQSHCESMHLLTRDAKLATTAISSSSSDRAV